MLSKGGFRRPFKTSTKIRDIIVSRGKTHLQEISTELRRELAAIPRARAKARWAKRHLPSLRTVRIYVHLALKLGLVEYTGETGMAHRKGKGDLIGPDAPDLAERQYLRLTPGKQGDLAWEDLWSAYRGQPIRPPEEGRPPRAIPPRKTRPPKKAPEVAAPSRAIKELEELELDIEAIKNMVDGLPGNFNDFKVRIETAFAVAQRLARRLKDNEKAKANSYADALAATLDSLDEWDEIHNRGEDVAKMFKADIRGYLP